MQPFIIRDNEGVPLWLNNDTYTIKLDKGNTGGSISIIQGFVGPGGGPIWHLHEDADEIFYVLDGQLTVRAGENIFQANPGDFVYVPKGIYHQFRNNSIKPIKILLMFSPAGFEGFFRETGIVAKEGVTPPLHIHDAEANRRAIKIGGKYLSFVPDFENPDINPNLK
ncbi:MULTISPECIES: cupin domain-containing protein [Klebsiella/Raoultella group]|uniref:Quercetin 2,3-dioxygenase n=1 Tax=Raoultella planticola TaxID=575 RepID=A0A485CRU1_RAOPL|nr:MULTISPECIES: cupin domain-containing protein [Klebsiella/Raoultella group]ELT9604894.1 cupin domain-containing protein [Raoultella planticola]HBQ3193986.1 cupin domain-containing protein [Klebsiella variicola subsp. variicola]HDT4281596.1 cupin domain-containing protein [Klebsiella pneumoniae subsp. pneumoniae]EIY5082333.1 cupin domain-containing protein [Klebsiella variicola]EKX9435201.1 cupin domain-containing protein [Klebsiella pneumoniae]